MPVSIVHIGLPLDHPLIPVEDRAKVRKRLDDLRQTMMDAGYSYEILHASPETGLEDFRRHLETDPCDGVLIGGGVLGDASMTYFVEQIINTAHEIVPKAKVMFYSHAMSVRETVERWFPPQMN